MNIRKGVAATLITGLLAVSMPLGGWAESGKISVHHRGPVSVRTASGWVKVSSQVPVGRWLRTGKGASLSLELKGAVVRLRQNTEVRVDSADTLTVRKGRIMAHVDSGSLLHVAGGGRQLVSRGGEFVFDVDGLSPRLHVFEGQARFVGQKAGTPRFVAASDWVSDNLLAMANPSDPYAPLVQQTPLHEMGDVAAAAVAGGGAATWYVLGGLGLAVGVAAIIVSNDTSGADLPPFTSP